MHRPFLPQFYFVLMYFSAAQLALAADQPQWGARYSRNLVSDERNLPDSFDPDTGENVRWVFQLGSNGYATPIIAEGRVLIGTNNEPPRDPKNRGDRGVLLCLNETDGKLLWHLAVPKRKQFNDWPNVGICSPPTVESGRVYLTSNRGEVLCLDLAGQANGNDGPFTDEASYMVPAGAPPLDIGPRHADILWQFDMFEDLGVETHDEMHSSALLHGDVLYVGTSNGVDGTHRHVPAPDAPSLIALDKHTGRLLARDREPIGEHITHSTWSSPSLGAVGGRELIFFGAGNAIVYAFEPLLPRPEGEGRGEGSPVATLKVVWHYDCDPGSPRGELDKFQGNRRTGPSTITGMPVFDQG